MLSVVVLSHVINDGIHLESFCFKIPIVSLLFRITVYFLLFLYDSDSKFYFLELLFTFLLTYVTFLVSARTSNPPPLPPLLVRLFSVCAVVPILLLFWGVTKFQGTYHCSLYLYILSFLFFVDSYFAGARETQEDTL